MLQPVLMYACGRDASKCGMQLLCAWGQPEASITCCTHMPQATDELEVAQAQLASTQAAMNDLLHGGLLTNAEPGQGATSRTRPAAAPATDSSDVIGAANGAPALNASMHLRSAELQTDRDEWRRRAERACADLSALREHVTAVCAEGRHAEIGLLNAQQVTRNRIHWPTTHD